ncbi:uncharacterized protein GGS22DRAFT_63746 [Annulohypoxylon maeteangense]|uniref:uncharacterized protein n=1 Tax=Annulohypoxylon maeteangense TaxID=1927788 RepID=UPI00200740EB|nr:uncharacterized protein GGS22DRAFT_63746 [Annulohypoxylon maeteangense]KAI0888851.1 hypothetical protein GGS22DRAFT_63746 [Annulohypoxylon maeteangense]
MLQKDVAANFSDYLQRASKEQSSVVERMKEFIACGERIKHQLESNYLDLASYEPISEVPVNTTPEEAPATKISPDTQETYNQLNHVSSCTKRESSVSSIKSRTRSKCPPRRSRASVTSGTVSDTEFSCQPQFGKLWKPDEIAPTSTRDTAVSDELDSSMPIGEPEKCLSQEELIAEVKGIYAGLVMVESKCIEVDNFQEQPIAEVNGIYAGLVMVESKCIEVEDFQPTQDKTRLDNRERKTNIARLASLHETSLAFEDDDPKHITSTKSLTVERLRECMERLEAASSNLSSSFREPFVALFDAISDWTARLVDDKPGLERYKESHRIIVKNLWRLIRSLRPSLFMPLVSSFHKACASPLRAVPGIEDGKSQDPLAFSIFWYTCLLGVVLGYIALAVYHRDRSFLGVGMGVSAWAYLAMVLVGDEPIHVIVR